MPAFTQKPLSSSLELLQCALAAGQEQLSDGSGRMGDVLEPSLFLKTPDDPRGHKVSLAACLASLRMKRLRGKWGKQFLSHRDLTCLGICLLAPTWACFPQLSKWLRNACDEKRKYNVSPPQWSGLPRVM